MTSSEGNSYLETLRFEENNINCFPRDQSLSNLLFNYTAARNFEAGN